MKFAPLFLFAIFLGIGVSCGEKKVAIEKTKENTRIFKHLRRPFFYHWEYYKWEATAIKKIETSRDTFTYTNLSNHFDFTEVFTDAHDDYRGFYKGVLKEIWIKDKTTKKIVQVIRDSVERLCYFPLSDPPYSRSFLTKVNVEVQPVDNYKGNLVVADFNFDHLDDFASAIGETTSTPGYYYAIYLQNRNGKFYKSPFLSKEMEFVPTKFDSINKTLTCITGCMPGLHKSIVKLDTVTNKWSLVKTDFIRFNENPKQIEEFLK